MPRINVRFHPETLLKIRQWADQRDVSVNEYITEAVEKQLRREAGDYDLPTLEQQRLNQLIDAYVSLESRFESVEKVIVTMSNSIIGMVRGDNYLMDDDDGELSSAFGGGR